MKKRIVIALTLIGAALATGGFFTFSARANKPSSLAPENLAALESDSTVVSGVPSATRAVGTPKPGDVHRLGYGALAWQNESEVCYIGLGSGGCIAQLPKPVSVTIGDQDALRPGTPAYVAGIASNNTVSVTAILNDGRSASAPVVDNFYYVIMPSDASIYDVSLVRANLADGSQYEENVGGGRAPSR